MKYLRPTNGERYTLEQLFSEDNKIIIPDLQRDYCWPEHKDGALVTDFVAGLVEHSKDDDYPLGLIYGYEHPVGHIQLCDGQQRITTLFLLVGLLYRRTGLEYLRRILISDFEMSDDYEPRLQYAIRESTLYFLSDLTRTFFVDHPKFGIDDIHRQTWYFHDYDLDPSICNMIEALRIIDRYLDSIADLNRLSEFIARKISFLYYDLQSRKNGEETFVIINTTGEPLSVTENLKPHIIHGMPIDKQKEGSDHWEKMETWFWAHRGQNDTADNGLLEFFRWVAKLSGQSDMKKIAFNSLWHYFEVVCELFENPRIFLNESYILAPREKGNNQIDWFRILPVIEYVCGFRYGIENERDILHERDILRVKNYFGHLSKIPNIGRDIQDLLPKAIEIVKKMVQTGQRDIAVHVVSDTAITSALRSREEVRKFNLYLESEDREAREDRFWQAEEHRIWQGQIMPLLDWSMAGSEFSLSRFDRMNGIFNELFSCEDLDETRRALLAWEVEDYPRIFSGYTNYSFCQNDSDWKTLIKDNVEKFGAFLERLSGATDIRTEQRRIIEEYSGESEWKDFIKIPEFLQYCERKNIQKWGESIGLIRRTYATTYVYAKVYKLYLSLKTRFAGLECWGASIYQQEDSIEIRFDPAQRTFRICTKEPETAARYGLKEETGNDEFFSDCKNEAGIEAWMEETFQSSICVNRDPSDNI